MVVFLSSDFNRFFLLKYEYYIFIVLMCGSFFIHCSTSIMFLCRHLYVLCSEYVCGKTGCMFVVLNCLQVFF